MSDVLAGHRLVLVLGLLGVTGLVSGASYSRVRNRTPGWCRAGSSAMLRQVSVLRLV